MSSPINKLSKEDKKKITDAIETAELNTSGEIRVHIESSCKEDPLDRAAYWFSELNMHKTELRNGVLFYLAIEDKKFAILGDLGINQHIEDNFWNETKSLMLDFFKDGKIAKGLSVGIIQAGLALKKYFPYQTDDVNELSDEISFGK